MMLGFCGGFDGLVQDCSISIANAMEILQSCTKPLLCFGYSLVAGEYGLSLCQYKDFVLAM